MKKILIFFKSHILIIVLSILLIIIYLFYKDFFNLFNFATIMGMASIIGFLVLGQAIVIISGGIDLSVGGIASLSSVTLAWSMIFFLEKIGLGIIETIILSIILALTSGFFIGIMNGFAVAKLKIQPLIATLGGMWIALGIAEFVFSGVPTRLAIEGFEILGRGKFFNFLPYTTIFFLLLVLINYFILNKRKAGKYVYAVGGSSEAAYLSGIRVNRVLISTYTISGILASIGGIFLSSWLRVGDSRGAQGYEFIAITAVVMAGFSLLGGVGNIVDAVLGVIILEIIRRLIPFLGISPFYGEGVIGLILLIAVTLNLMKYKKEKA